MTPMPAPRARLSPPSLVDYGVIGDLHTAALVSKHGSLDWLCLPRLDSPSVFAALLDDERGGQLRIAAREPYESSQAYVRDTNLLQTEFVTESGRALLTSFMPVEEIDGEEYAFQELHHVLEVRSGRMSGDALFAPRFNYGMAVTNLETQTHGILARGAGQQLVLSSDMVWRLEGDAAIAEWSGIAGERLRCVLRYGTGFARPVGAYDTDGKRRATEAYWRAWSARSSYAGRDRDAVQRSALALKLLTYAPTGALAAAVTTSLPEALGGGRNWDYRFSWVRDSAFAMQAFNALGYVREARRYLRWLRRLLRGLAANVADLRVGYGLEGETEAPEQELGYLKGYLGSRPVRIGNAALRQFQLDIYGSVADAVFEAYRLPGGFPDEAWRTVRAIADYVVEHWQEPDHGIWEIRGPRRRYTHSALMSWVALDRAMRIAEARGHSEYNQSWGTEREQIRSAILTQGWDPGRGTFVQSFGAPDLDASLLLVPIVGFLPPRDPRVRSTIDALDHELGQGPFVYRYRGHDHLEGDEGAFLICSFWMVHALALAGRLDEARRRFEDLVRLAGPLGLFSEEVDPASGRALGNFPQALTHLSHINAAVALDAALPRAAPVVHGERVITRDPVQLPPP